MTEPNIDRHNQRWRDLCRALRNEAEIKTWGHESGYGKPFQIWEVRLGVRPSIIIYSPTTKKRTISKNEFLEIAPGWAAYRDRGVGRDVMQIKSQNTSYIFGLLKWLEDQTTEA